MTDFTRGIVGVGLVSTLSVTMLLACEDTSTPTTAGTLNSTPDPTNPSTPPPSSPPESTPDPTAIPKSEPTLAPTVAPTREPTPAPLSVGSASEAPDHVRLDIDDGIVVAFADDPALGRVAYVTHVASGAQVVLDTDGNVTARYDSLGNDGWLLDVALADGDDMARILSGLRYSSTLRRNAIADWLNLIQFYGVQYGLIEERQLDQTQLGPVVYRVAFSLDANLLPIDYQIQDGDAAFLEPGTAIHSVNGYDPSKRLAAIVDGEVLLFERSGPAK